MSLRPPWAVRAEPCETLGSGSDGCTSGTDDGGFVGSLASDAWEGVCQAFGGAAVDLLKAFADAFASFPSIDPQDEGIRAVFSISLGIAAVVMVLLVLIQIVRTVLTHDGAGAAHALVGLGKAVLAFLLTCSVCAAAIQASNDITKFIITSSFEDTDGLKERITAAFVLAAVKGESATLVMVLAVVAIVCTLVLWFELMLANAAIAVLIGTSPIAAAGQTSTLTAGWWPKLVSATVQLIVLKPVIALVFSIGFSLMGKSQDVAGLMSGVLVLVMAVFAWPAVGKFFTFASVQLGGASGVGAVLGFAAARTGTGASSPGPALPGTGGDDFAAAAAGRSMATHAARTGGSKALGAALAGVGTAIGGPAGGAVGKFLAGNAPGVLDAAQRSVNSLAGRMGQTAGHAGLDAGNPHPYPAGHPRPTTTPLGTPPAHPTQGPRPGPGPGPGPGAGAGTGTSVPGPQAPPDVDLHTAHTDTAPHVAQPADTDTDTGTGAGTDSGAAHRGGTGTAQDASEGTGTGAERDAPDRAHTAPVPPPPAHGPGPGPTTPDPSPDGPARPGSSGSSGSSGGQVPGPDVARPGPGTTTESTTGGGGTGDGAGAGAPRREQDRAVHGGGDPGTPRPGHGPDLLGRAGQGPGPQGPDAPGAAGTPEVPGSATGEKDMGGPAQERRRR